MATGKKITLVIKNKNSENISNKKFMIKYLFNLKFTKKYFILK